MGNPYTTQHDVGTTIATELGAGGFEQAEEIGRGGYGIVYRCTQSGLDRVVAVKVLTAELNEDRQRFVREQQAMGRLTGHPNIVAVLQVGETESGHPYLVMPFCRRGSVQKQIERFGVLSVDEVLRLGVRLAGALESAHRVGILHRDIKPANIMLTDYGEPALIDFGIAHVSGGFMTTAGTIAGTPAFTAPEVLGGDPPTEASDVYSLGATLFCALTGHAAFERRSGEEVVAHFLRIAAAPVPDLSQRGIPDDLTAVVEKAMSSDPRGRPSVLAVGEQLQQLESRRGLVVDEMALQGRGASDQPARGPVQHTSRRGTTGRYPAQLATVLGRSAELDELRRLLSTSRLVTLTGVGGVGKTTLAIQAGRDLWGNFADGVSLVELSDLRDGALLTEVVAAALDVRESSARSLIDVLIEFLQPREALMVLDNCEQIVDAAAELVAALLRDCPRLRILATSREVLGIDGESVLALSPLSCPDTDSDTTLRDLSDYAAVELFVERARSRLPGFALTDTNKDAIAHICSRVDGLPLAIELAAARLRALSAQQIADGLSDRYALLNRGRRGAPARQQTLAFSVGWSYDLCSQEERQLWGRLSVFAGSFDLDAAHDICGAGLDTEDFLDHLSALVDKSILIRTEHDNTVRFRLLETLRAYGHEHIAESDDYTVLRQRHADWYHRLLVTARAEWFGPSQVQCSHRLMREMPNIREVLAFKLEDSPPAAVEMMGALRPFWFTRGMLSEGRRWLDLALAATSLEPTPQRIRALCDGAWIANGQQDFVTVKSRVAEARDHLQVISDPQASGLIDCCEGYVALNAGEFAHACELFRRAQEASDDFEVQVVSLILMGWLLDPSWFHKALALAESRGEFGFRSVVLASIGVSQWLRGEPQPAEQALRQGLQLAYQVNDPRNAAECLLGLAWIAGSQHNARRAVVLTAAATALTRSIGAPLHAFPQLEAFHTDCERRAREELEPAEFDSAWREGSSLTFDEAVSLEPSLGE
jgi:serine/threonine-protein kinase PknK